MQRNLNHYIEAQVHGDVLFGRDVAGLVVDPAFVATEVGAQLVALCQRHRIPRFVHGGFRLAAAEVPRDFRGPTMVSLAERVAVAGFVDAFAIGAAVRDLLANPSAWLDRGDHGATLQELKLLWHVLVKYGQPAHREAQLLPFPG